ncbi:allantoate deiminase [Paenibacillus caui]|uniref:allantoate deiminase n=1 Tax=Paenibacillus caui TaxID=2873927 RepID=UPI001CAA3217|nr:allantoate deiminase [Paenibacillus caui]
MNSPHLLQDKSDFSEVVNLLDELAGFGMEEDGGVTRLLYTKPWVEAQSFLADKMREAGLEVHFDRVGNLYGRLPGRDADLPVILTGSHIDTVRSGGKYDGAFGIAAGLTALTQLKEKFGQPSRTLEVVALCEEEGSRFPLTFWGSGSVTGFHDPAVAGKVRDEAGISLREAMLGAGFGLAEQQSPLRDDLGMYIELHIEQGVALERMNKRIGIVETIVGQHRYTVTVSGERNHAGTTPMHMRSDALAGAAEMIFRLEAMAGEAGDPLVATVGKIAASPNTSNVIPGEVSFTLDIRHDTKEELTAFCSKVSTAFEQIARKRGLGLDLQLQLETEPVPMDSAIKERLESLCGELKLPYRRMVSGAGHDAQLLASLCPSAMLFVPSRGGISHSPEEFTSPEHLTEGAALLAVLLHQLAY